MCVCVCVCVCDQCFDGARSFTVCRVCVKILKRDFGAGSGSCKQQSLFERLETFMRGFRVLRVSHVVQCTMISICADFCLHYVKACHQSYFKHCDAMLTVRAAVKQLRR